MHRLGQALALWAVSLCACTHTLPPSGEPSGQESRVSPPPPEVPPGQRPVQPSAALRASPLTEVPSDQRPVQSSAALRRFMAQVHGSLKEPWEQVRFHARTSFAVDHAVNRQDRFAVAELRINPKGAPFGARIVRSSGLNLFDNSALRVFSWIKRLPPLPANLPEGDLFLRWTFFRDERACAPEHAALNVRPLTPEESMGRALGQQDWQRAEQLIQENPGAPAVMAVLARAGLRHESEVVRRLALEAAPAATVQAALKDTSSGHLWPLAMKVLVARKAEAPLKALLSATLNSPAYRLQARPALREVMDQRLVQLLVALSRLGSTLSPTNQRAVLASRSDAVVRAALPLATDPGALVLAGKTLMKRRSEVAVFLAVRKLSMGPDDRAAAYVRKFLAGPRRDLAMQALERYPLPIFTQEMATIAGDRLATQAVRLAAIRVYGAICPELTPLYAVIRSDRPAVQISGAEALSHCFKKHPGKQKVITYRLADLAYRSKGRVRATALASQARVGFENFREDLLRRAARLEPEQMALVVAELWGYAERALPRLRELITSPSPAVRQAALDALRRIPGEAARQLLTTTELAREIRPDQPHTMDPIEQLLLATRRAAASRAPLEQGADQTRIPSKK